MLRLVFVLSLVGGCDFVMQISHVEKKVAACGPYTTVTPVAISSRVTEARHFSISDDGVGPEMPPLLDLAMVVGRLDGGSLRPILLRDVGGTWEPDTQMNTGFDQIPNLIGANLAPAEFTPIGDHYTGFPKRPVMMLWSGFPSQLSRYYWAGSTWTFDAKVNPIADNEYDIRAGNVITVIGAGGEDDIVRHTVTINHATDPTMSPDTIVFMANNPSAPLLEKFNLEDKPARTRPLNGNGFDFGQAVVTQNLETLAYAADAGADSDIYASLRSDANDFDQGGQIQGINTGADELEPWIDGDCSRLYFRRADAGRPNDPGQIFLAE